jgi:hypothetical protein
MNRQVDTMETEGTVSIVVPRRELSESAASDDSGLRAGTK